LSDIVVIVVWVTARPVACISQQRACLTGHERGAHLCTIIQDPSYRTKVTQQSMDGKIHAALFSRGDGFFHWAFIIGCDSKLHVTNKDSASWRYEKTTYDDTALQYVSTIVVIGMSARAKIIKLFQPSYRPSCQAILKA
jgi:hypothetical protein